MQATKKGGKRKTELVYTKIRYDFDKTIQSEKEYC